MAPLLDIKDLHTEIRLRRSTVHAIGGVNLTVDPGECLGIVGESGCGKTMTALSVMRLLPNGGHIVGGSVTLDGRDITHLDDEAMRDVRGNVVGMIFQDPMTSLNPTMTIGDQIAESVRLHRGADKQAGLERAVEVLGLVGMPKPAERVGNYPHQLSGGMRQRVMIAMALACEPKLLIADEPTTALDVTIQKQILELIDNLRQRLGMAVILVTHDLGVIAGRADRVAVMYAGKVVETTDTATLFANPRHPYTEALFEALPDKIVEPVGVAKRLYNIPGQPPDLTRPAQGLPVRGAVPVRAGLLPGDRAQPDGRRAAARVPLLLPGRRGRPGPRRPGRGRAHAGRRRGGGRSRGGRGNCPGAGHRAQRGRRRRHGQRDAADGPAPGQGVPGHRGRHHAAEGR